MSRRAHAASMRPGELELSASDPPYRGAMQGDRVEIVVDVGDGVRQFEVAATRAGRRVEVSIARGTVEVSEVTRSGQTVRSARFMATRVVALVEHPAAEERRTSRARPGSTQPSLGLGPDPETPAR
jgi:hypothetical protein